MKKIHFVTLLFVMMCAGISAIGCATNAGQAPWSLSDRILLSTALALHGSDWMQTKDGISNREMQENNMFLGGSPDEKDIDLYFASTAAGMSVLTVYSSKGWRRAFLIGWCFIELICVMHNQSMGLQVSI